MGFFLANKVVAPATVLVFKDDDGAFGSTTGKFKSIEGGAELDKVDRIAWTLLSFLSVIIGKNFDPLPWSFFFPDVKLGDPSILFYRDRKWR
jgi:hypothetical protein